MSATALVCELCKASDFERIDGFFICQGCGCKYSLSEAKKCLQMGQTKASAKVVPDPADDCLKMAEVALAAGNDEEAYKYANKVLEYDAKHCRAWQLKMKAAGGLGTLGNPRADEMIAYGENAIASAESSEKDDVAERVYHFFMLKAFTLLIVATSHANDTEDAYKMFRLYAQLNPFTAAGQTSEYDAHTVSMVRNLAAEACAIMLAVPSDQVRTDGDLQALAKAIGAQYETYINALDARLYHYKAERTPMQYDMDDEQLERLNADILLDHQAQALIEAKKEKQFLKMRQQYFLTHPGEEGNYEIAEDLMRGVMAAQSTVDEKMEEQAQMNTIIDEINTEIKREYRMVERCKRRLFGRQKALRQIDEHEGALMRLNERLHKHEAAHALLRDSIQKEENRLQALEAQFQPRAAAYETIKSAIEQLIEDAPL